MVNVNDILTRLEKGESLDNIAAEFTNALNTANTQYLEKQKAEAEAAAAVEAKKDELVKTMVDAVNDYIELCAPGLLARAGYDTDGDVMNLKTSIDAMVNTLITLDKISQKFDNVGTATSITPSSTATKKSISDDEILANFITKIIG